MLYALFDRDRRIGEPASTELGAWENAAGGSRFRHSRRRRAGWSGFAARPPRQTSGQEFSLATGVRGGL